MNQSMKRFSSFIFLNAWKLFGAYYIKTTCELQFILRVRSYFFHAIYQKLFIARVTNYFLYASYELLFTVRVVVVVVLFANLGTPWFILDIDSTS